MNTFHRYGLHLFLQSLAQELFFSFGAILIFLKTNSFTLTLLFGFTGTLLSLFFKSIGLRIWWDFLFQKNAILSMALGNFCMALSFTILYFLQPKSGWGVLFSLSILMKSFGNSAYWIPSNGFLLAVVGAAEKPGRASALLSVVLIIASLVSALVALLFTEEQSFLFLLLFAALASLASIIPLWHLQVPFHPRIESRSSWKGLSWKAILANINPDHRFVITGLPLFLIQFFDSALSSIWIVATSALLSAGFVFIAGKHKDSKNPNLYVLAAIINTGVWIVYAFASAPLSFIFLGVLLAVSSSIINTGREARLSREAVSAEDSLQIAAGVEIARSIGAAIGTSILFLVFLMFQHLPQMMFLLAALFVLPRAFYAIGNVQQKEIQ